MWYTVYRSTDFLGKQCKNLFFKMFINYIVILLLLFCSLQDLGFIRLWSKVQTAHFKMRSNQLMLHEDFYVALMELPTQYDFGMYSRFLNTFGTHYVTEGTMGGKLEYVYVLNKAAMANSSTVTYPAEKHWNTERNVTQDNTCFILSPNSSRLWIWKNWEVLRHLFWNKQSIQY